MKVAVIDIGTLKIKFLIAEITSPTSFKTLYSSNTLTCLGLRIHENNNEPLKENLEATINELKRCKELLDKEKVGKVRAVSTHALREMGQVGKDIVKKIKKEVGLDVEIISAKEEATLFFQAVMKEFNTDEDLALVDVGGGSVQILIGNKNKLKHVFLLKTGAQYLWDNFSPRHAETDALKKEEVKQMQKYIQEQISSLPAHSKIPVVYGSSCILEVFEAVKIPMTDYPFSENNHSKVSVEQLQSFLDDLVYIPYGERKNKYYYHKQPFFMWGIDKGLMNIIAIAKHLESPYIIPTNSNINNGLVLSLI
jgi:exopolyphosphatase/guanosine-5'-triphosphate,3'-diphosphate pyrophosphatase